MHVELLKHMDVDIVLNKAHSLISDSQFLPVYPICKNLFNYLYSWEEICILAIMWVWVLV